ncbi:hypothetical protein MCP_2080 [Methanocella paludicola SANAE]|uniref:HTH arsR-type domain-containing protein n=1 Tax=Methanocella paludicola (strain DSM 17711 / JCM 13418 / NBRC 101707 / SANAE) TaxID=304371 RepID=D1Z0D0_METPS|nr:hypothetical protein [Methanocella paludicola]BAI62152.1 hypothetical protein MCP_2080 [Methanocella paludicola SANAE]
MSLSDFLGDTSQIKIIDFFLGDAGNSYNISELSEMTGLTRMTLSKFIPELVQSRILEVDQSAGNVKTYRLAKNRLVELIVASACAYSSIQGSDPLDKEESIGNIRKGLGLSGVVSERITEPRIESASESPCSEGAWSFPSEGIVILTKESAKKLRDELDDKIRKYENLHGEILINE